MHKLRWRKAPKAVFVGEEEQYEKYYATNSGSLAAPPAKSRFNSFRPVNKLKNKLYSSSSLLDSQEVLATEENDDDDDDEAVELLATEQAVSHMTDSGDLDFDVENELQEDLSSVEDDDEQSREASRIIKKYCIKVAVTTAVANSAVSVPGIGTVAGLVFGLAATATLVSQ